MNPNFWNDLHKNQPRSERFTDDFVCPRWANEGGPGEGKAKWGPDECCTHCGSLHPDVLMERLENRSAHVGTTSKNYKIYVHSPANTPQFKQTFRGDSDPGGNDPAKWVWTTREINQAKFYFQHMSEAQKNRFIELLNEKAVIFEGGYGFTALPFFIKR